MAWYAIGLMSSTTRAVRTLLKQTIGMMLMCIGGMGGDSEVLWLPLLLIALGAYLITHK